MNYDKKEFLTIPNLLSLIRILLIPVYAVIYMKAQEMKEYFMAACIFAISAITDMADGIIARKFNMRSRIGIMLDPFADKLTQGVIIICLALKNEIIIPLLVIFVLKEMFMLVMSCRLLKQGKMLDGALFAGKICTTVLFISMIVLVIFNNVLHPNVIIGIVFTCVVFMVISFVSYARCFFGASSHIKNIEDAINEENKL